MNVLEEAYAVVKQASDRLHSLIEAKLSRHEYEGVADVVGLAEALSSLIPSRPSEAADAPSDDSSTEGSLPSQRKGKKPKTYPFFSRESDRLVKSGWSKRSKSVYKHRVDRNTAESVHKRIVLVSDKSSPFTVDDLVSFADESDDFDIPNYQIYLVVAWLRWLKILDKVGRDKYSFDERNGLSFSEIWDSTPRSQEYN